MKLNKTYLLLALLVLAAEIFIAIYLHDAIIRPYGGDFLVVILIYCFIKAFINTPVLLTAACVVAFAYAVEISQYFHLVSALGLQKSGMAKLLLGTSFSFTDMACYTLGMLLVIVVESFKRSLRTF